MSRWDSDAFENREIAQQILGDIKSGGLGYLFHPLFGWRPKPNINLKTVSTNEFGLRSKPFSDLSDSRCFVIGGSFSWGYGATSNESIPSYLLEEKLEEKNVSVINLAEQMFSSSQQLQSFIFSVSELKPDYVICVTGYNDVSQGFRNIYRNHPEYQKYDSFISWGNQNGLISGESNIKKALKVMYHKGEYKDPYTSHFTFSNPEKDDIPMLLTSETVKIIDSYCLNNNIKAAFVLEPLVYSKKHQTDSEKAILEYVGKEKQDYFIKSFDELREKIWKNNSSSSLFIDSGEFFEDEEKTIFFDDIHMSDRGYKIWTERLYNELDKKHFW